MSLQGGWPDEEYEQAARDYLLIEARTRMYTTPADNPDHNPDHNPVLQAALDGMQHANKQLHDQLRACWMDLHNGNDDPAYRARLFGQCDAVFIGLRALARYAKKMPAKPRR